VIDPPVWVNVAQAADVAGQLRDPQVVKTALLPRPRAPRKPSNMPTRAIFSARPKR
jgi:hypothetical protein